MVDTDNPETPADKEARLLEELADNASHYSSDVDKTDLKSLYKISHETGRLLGELENWEEEFDSGNKELEVAISKLRQARVSLLRYSQWGNQKDKKPEGVPLDFKSVYPQ